MKNVALYTTNEERLDGPENEHLSTAFIEYDPRDPASLQSAREALKKKFGLNYLPVLCNEPEPSIFEKWFGNWFGRRDQNDRIPDVMARPAKHSA